MPRKPVIKTAECPYHISGRSNNREWYGLSLENCYDIYAEVLLIVIERYKIDLHAFVLMNNHFHMIISTPKANISEAMRYFMTETARRLRRGCSRINHVYGGRYKWSLLESSEVYAYCLKYVYRNPVKAKITSAVQDYQWSTISNLDNKIKKLITKPSNHSASLPDTLEDQLAWFNIPTPKELDEATRLALKRPRFEFKPTRSGGKKVNYQEHLPLCIRKK